MKPLTCEWPLTPRTDGERLHLRRCGRPAVDVRGSGMAVCAMHRYGSDVDPDVQRTAEALFQRLLRLSAADMLVVERCVRRLEPAGRLAWCRYCDLRREIRRCDGDSARMDALLAEASALGREWDFLPERG
jgi:hypothetical protein